MSQPSGGGASNREISIYLVPLSGRIHEIPNGASPKLGNFRVISDRVVDRSHRRSKSS
jgi:hypothetical protein